MDFYAFSPCTHLHGIALIHPFPYQLLILHALLINYIAEPVYFAHYLDNIWQYFTGGYHEMIMLLLTCKCRIFMIKGLWAKCCINGRSYGFIALYMWRILLFYKHGILSPVDQK